MELRLFRIFSEAFNREEGTPFASINLPLMTAELIISSLNSRHGLRAMPLSSSLLKIFSLDPSTKHAIPRSIIRLFYIFLPFETRIKARALITGYKLDRNRSRPFREFETFVWRFRGIINRIFWSFKSPRFHFQLKYFIENYI